MKSLYVILVAALGVIGLGLTLAMHGEADDAPGLALIGIVLITGAYAFAVRTAYRAGRTKRAALSSSRPRVTAAARAPSGTRSAPPARP